jgi:hypothetical protein
MRCVVLTSFRASPDNPRRRPLLKRALGVVAGVAVVVAAVAAGPTLLSGVESYSVDGVAGIIGPFVAPEDTVYAPKYTLTGWKKVRIGMSQREVDAILGPAQLTYRVYGRPDGADTGARWSYSPGDTNFRRRVLLFRKGIVVEKWSEYYLD